MCRGDFTVKSPPLSREKSLARALLSILEKVLNLAMSWITTTHAQLATTTL